MDKYYTRQITEKIKKLIAHFPCIVIIGARQVGKSTLLKKLFPDYNYVLFDPVVDIENARKDPDLIKYPKKSNYLFHRTYFFCN